MSEPAAYWRRLETIFGELVELPKDQREAHLERACAGDEELRRQVEELLAADEQATGDFMTSPAFRSAEHESGLDPPLVGAYRLVRRVGEGGMSVVWLAARADEQFHRRVAVKLLRHGMTSREQRRRMRHERQILAALSHPNIAQLIDAGETVEGRPYFVMEYIDGEPIADFCDRQRLSIEERIELFRAVCSAVHYAHQNLVIHRDIKSTNILVTGDGVPKLLDFGIAKLLNPSLVGQEVEPTLPWGRMLTPEYASPEQVQGRTVTTASDVYSLGVLLYRLLCGHLPFHFSEPRPREIERVLSETTVEPPSQAALRDEAGSEQSMRKASVARVRRLQPERLHRRLQGDLDTLIAKAMRREPHRRYGSVEQLSEDLRRHLVGLPILARGDTLGYRARKFLRRHRLAVGVGVIFVALVIGFGVAMAVQSQRLARERDQARQLADLLKEIFEVADPTRSSGEELTARELLDHGAERVIWRLDAQPELQAELMTTLALTYEGIGVYEEAQSLFELALEQQREHLGNDAAEAARTELLLGRVLSTRGQFALAQEKIEGALALFSRRWGEKSPDAFGALASLGSVHFERGDLEAAEEAFQRSLSMGRELFGDSSRLTEPLSGLGVVDFSRGDYEAAEGWFLDVLEIERRELGPTHLKTASTLANLAAPRLRMGDHEGAASLYRQAMEIQAAGFGPQHPEVAQTMIRLALVLAEQGQGDEATGLYEQALEIFLQVHGPEHRIIGSTLNNFAALRLSQGDFEVAEELHRRAFSVWQGALGEEHAQTGHALHGVARALLAQGKNVEAEKAMRRVLRIWGQATPGHWRLAQAEGLLGLCLARQGRFEEAELPLITSYLALAEKHGDESSYGQEARERLAELYALWERPAAAEHVRSGGVIAAPSPVWDGERLTL